MALVALIVPTWRGDSGALARAARAKITGSGNGLAPHNARARRSSATSACPSGDGPYRPVNSLVRLPLLSATAVPVPCDAEVIVVVANAALVMGATCNA